MAEARGLAHVLFARFASPLEMALEQTAAAVGGIDTVVVAKDRPGRFYRRPHGALSTILRLRMREMSVLGNSRECEMFPLFPRLGLAAIPARNASVGQLC